MEASFTPDGAYVLAGTAGGEVVVWSIAARREVARLGGHATAVGCVKVRLVAWRGGAAAGATRRAVLQFGGWFPRSLPRWWVLHGGVGWCVWQTPLTTARLTVLLVWCGRLWFVFVTSLLSPGIGSASASVFHRAVATSCRHGGSGTPSTQ